MINIDYIEAAKIVYALQDCIKEEEKRLERVGKLGISDGYCYSIKNNITDLQALICIIRGRVNNAIGEEVL